MRVIAPLFILFFGPFLVEAEVLSPTIVFPEAIKEFKDKVSGSGDTEYVRYRKAYFVFWCAG